MKRKRPRGGSAGAPAAPPRPMSVSAALLGRAGIGAATPPDFEAVRRTLAEARQRDGLVPAAFQVARRRDVLEQRLAERRRAVAERPSAERWFSLAHALAASGARLEAVAAYRRSLALGYDAETVTYFLAALDAAALPDAAPAGYVAALYDGYAGAFEADLVGTLKYQVPELLFEAVSRILPAGGRGRDVIDLGCGTGLVGRRFRALARRLDGIDLSAGMVEQARAKGIYDSLAVGELVAALDRAAARYDLALAGDVLIYLGDLAPAFAAAHRALRPGGLFGFTVEAAPETVREYGLAAHGRYRHSAAHVARAAAEAGFEVVLSEACVPRFEAGEPVAGRLYLLRRA